MRTVPCVLLLAAAATTAVSERVDLTGQTARAVLHASSSPHLDDDDEYLSGVERSLLSQGGDTANVRRYKEQHADGGLKPKPVSSGPDGTAWRNSVAICSMIKDENTTDVREWVMYYRCGEWLHDTSSLSHHRATTPCATSIASISQNASCGISSGDGEWLILLGPTHRTAQFQQACRMQRTANSLERAASF